MPTRRPYDTIDAVRTVQPDLRHPLLWALTDVVGLSQSQVSSRSGVAKSTLRQLDLGARATDPVRSRLRRLLERSLSDLAAAHVAFVASSPLMHQQTQDYAPYRRALYAVVRQVLDETAAPERAHVQSDATFLTLLGERGRTRADMLHLMLPMDPTSVKRIARRLAVRRVDRPDPSGRPVRWWLPPSVAPVLRTERQALPRQRLKSPRSKELWGIVEKLFLRAERSSDGFGWIAVRTIERETRLKGFSRPLLYRTARKLQIVRRTVVDGLTRTTYWSLPAIPARKIT